MVFENYPLDRAALSESAGGLRIVEAEMRDATHYPLSLAIVPGERLHMRFDYGPARFSNDQVRRTADRLLRLLHAAIDSPEVLVYRLDVLSAAERRAVLEDFNQTAREIPESTFAGLFEAWSLRTPEATAVVHDDREISYGELNERANRLARHLVRQGVGPEMLVGLCFERSIEMVVNLLAVSKAGAAWLPLDPEYPERRLARILEVARPRLVVGRGKVLSRLPSETPCLSLDDPALVDAMNEEGAGKPANSDRAPA